jgi:hypothetical protein
LNESVEDRYGSRTIMKILIDRIAPMSTTMATTKMTIEKCKDKLTTKTKSTIDQSNENKAKRKCVEDYGWVQHRRNLGSLRRAGMLFF